MATLEFMDSFDHYSTAQVALKWDAANNDFVIGAYGRNGTNGARLGTGASAGYLTKNLTANQATRVTGAGIKPQNAGDGGSGGSKMFTFLDAGSEQVVITCASDGSLRAYRGNLTTLLGAPTAPGVVSFAAHQFIEAKVTIHDSAGVVLVKVDGVTVLNLTAQDTQATANAYMTQVRIGTYGQAGQNDYDDFYIADDFIGDTHWECLVPTSAGGVTNLTPTAGSNYQCVDEIPPTDDTDYVSSTLSGQKDRYNFPSLTATTGAVVAVGVAVFDRKDDAGARTHSAVVDVSGTESESSAWSPGTTYAFHQRIFHTKPGGGAFTIADVNAAEAGPKLAS